MALGCGVASADTGLVRHGAVDQSHHADVGSRASASTCAKVAKAATAQRVPAAHARRPAVRAHRVRTASYGAQSSFSAASDRGARSPALGTLPTPARGPVGSAWRSRARRPARSRAPSRLRCTRSHAPSLARRHHGVTGVKVGHSDLDIPVGTSGYTAKADWYFPTQADGSVQAQGVIYLQHGFLGDKSWYAALATQLGSADQQRRGGAEHPVVPAAFELHRMLAQRRADGSRGWPRLFIDPNRTALNSQRRRGRVSRAPCRRTSS